MMTDDFAAGTGPAEGLGDADLPPLRRCVRMMHVPGQALVLSTLGGCSGTAQAIEIRFAEVGADGTAMLDFLLPDHMFVEHKETMDSMQALFCALPTPCRGLED